MYKYIFGAVFSLSLLFSPAFSQAAGLNSAQIQSILSLLSSFGADQNVIDNVRTSLTGGTPTTPPQPASCLDLKYNLYFGIKDATTKGEVTKLQKFLTSEGVYNNDITGYYGPATERGVKKWQTQNDVVSSGSPESTGYGAVGPKTRAAIKKKTCGRVVNPKAGALNISFSSAIVAQNITPGAKKFRFAQLLLDATASSEDLSIAYVPVFLDSLNKHDLTSCQVFDGTRALNNGINIVNPTTPTKGVFNFDNALIVKKGTIKQLDLRCNISASAKDGTTFKWKFMDAPIRAKGVTTGNTVDVALDYGKSQTMTVRVVRPVITSIRSKAADADVIYVGEESVIHGTGLSGQISIKIGSKTVVINNHISDTFVQFIVPSLPAGIFNASVVNNVSGLVSNNFPVTVIVPTTQTQPFITVTSPNGGEVLTAGNKYTIHWNKNGFAQKGSKVDISLLDNSTRLGKVIFSGTPNDGSEGWVVQPLTTLISKDGRKINPSGKYVIHIQCSDASCTTDASNFPFSINAATTQTKPTASVTNGPTLKLGYDSNNKEASLTAKATIRITAGNTPQVVLKSSATSYPTSYIYLGMQAKTSFGVGVSHGAVRMGQPNVFLASSSQAQDSRNYWVIPAGKSASFNITQWFNPKKMFAGTYQAMPYVYNYVYNTAGTTNVLSQKGTTGSNTVTIIGETSPYISSATSDANGNVTIKGVRFDATGNLVDIGGVVRTYPSSNNGTTIVVPNNTAGTKYVQVTSQRTGKSNSVYVNISAPAQTVSITGITGNQASYSPNEAIDLWLTGTASSGTTASNAYGYNVQDYVHTASDTSFRNYLPPNPASSYNGTYDGLRNAWHVSMLAPSTPGSYNLRVILYCSKYTRCSSSTPETAKVIPFTVSVLTKPTITVTSPNGGEALSVGQTKRITWKSSSAIDKVTLGYSFGAGSINWIANNIPNTGYYDWKVDIGNTTNTKVKIKVIGYQTGVGSWSNQSDNFFTITSTSTSITPGSKLIATSGDFIVPAGVTKISIVGVGGGGGGGSTSNYGGYGPAGSGGGGASSATGEFVVTPGQAIKVSVGAAGTPSNPWCFIGNTGGDTTVILNGTTYTLGRGGGGGAGWNSACAGRTFGAGGTAIPSDSTIRRWSGG